MRDRITSLVAILLLSIVSATSYWYARSLHQQGETAALRPGTPDFYVEQFVLTVFDAAGQPRRRLYADRMTHVAENDDVALQRPRLLSIRAGQPQFEARSAIARLENTGEVLIMDGDVLVTRDAGPRSAPLRIDTDHLVARPEDDRYTTDSVVTVQRGDSTVSARGMDFDNIARTVEFKAAVRDIIAPR